MGRINSVVEKIENARFEAIPSGKSRHIVQLTRVDGVMFGLGKDGTIYTHHEICRGVHMCNTGSDYAPVKALHAFGVVTKEELRKHGEKKRAYDLNLERYYASVRTLEHMHNIGIKLTKGQIAKLKVAAAAVDIDNLPFFIKPSDAKRELGRK